MQRMILIPADQYDRMVESYDNVMQELIELRELLETMKEGEDTVYKD